MTAIRGYHVLESTPGYMPEVEPAHFNSKRAAHEYAQGLARELREAGYRVSGARGDYYGERPRDSYDLGRVIETVWCEEPECQDEEE